MSKLIECPTCKQPVSSGAATCPHCGEAIRKNKCRSVKGGFISLGAGILLCIALFAVGGAADSLAVGQLGLLMLIFGIVGACICFTSPSR